MSPCRAAPLLVLIIVLLPAAAARAAPTNDHAASRAYLRDAHAELAALQAHATSERAAVRSFVAHVAATCPHVEAGEPTNTATRERIEEALSNETVADLALVVEGPARRSVATLVARLAHLSWSEPSIERAVRRFERQTRGWLALGPSRLCADVRFSKAHHWRRLSPAARRFAAAFEATQKPAPPTAIGLGRMMKPFLGAAGRKVLNRLASLQAKTGTRLGRLISDELDDVFAVLD